jgi:hypothetical protein
MRNEYYAYPKIERAYDVYDNHSSGVREDYVRGGVLVSVEEDQMDDNRHLIGRQIFIAGYRHTPLVGRRRVRLILDKNEKRRTKYSLTQILRRDPVSGDVPTSFSFWPNLSSKHHSS